MEHNQMKIEHLILIILSLILVVPTVYADDYQDGVGAFDKKDFEAALKAYGFSELTKLKPLAEKGHANAQYLLGLSYDKGQGVLQDYKEAVKWLLKSAEQKNLKAQRLIRASYHKWHKQVAEQGDLYAERFLGDSYYLGLGVTQDYAEAAKWYKKAAEQGDSVSQVILGAMYEKGKGISKDFVEAYKWFSISGEADYGRMHREKLGKRKMATAQIAEAKKLAQEWMEKHQQK